MTAAAAAVLVVVAAGAYGNFSLSLISDSGDKTYRRSRRIGDLDSSIDALGTANTRTAVFDVTETSGVVGHTSAAVSLCIASLNALFEAGVLENIWQETVGEQNDGRDSPCETRLTCRALIVAVTIYLVYHAIEIRIVGTIAVRTRIGIGIRRRRE